MGTENEENKKIDEENKKIDEYNNKVDKYNQALENGENPGISIIILRFLSVRCMSIGGKTNS